jgi:lipoprotein-releasing system permease protein
LKLVRPGFQSFVAWRYLMERRRPVSPLVFGILLVFMMLGALGTGAALGFGVRHEAFAAISMCGHLLTALLGLAALGRDRRIHAPRALVVLVIGVVVGLAIPPDVQVGKLTAPQLSGLVGGVLGVLIMALLSSLGSRAMGAILLGLTVASGSTALIVQWVWNRFHEHNPGIRPYNQLVPWESPIHDTNSLVIWAARGSGLAFLAIGIVLAILRGRIKRTIGWGLILAGVVALAGGIALEYLVGNSPAIQWALQLSAYYAAPIILVLVLGTKRYFFTFFTTVSMAGVFVGSMALVVVLSIMGGFENDLRDKILASNAHIRVTREEGMIQDWREVMARVRGVRGVVATTPYATTEVVLSANSNYATVVIKGIDPETVGEVTKLVSDIEGNAEEDAAAMRRLYPLREDPSGVEPDPDADPAPDPDADPGVDDPAPDDMAGGDEPIDYSAGSDEPPPDPDVVDPAPADFEEADDEGEPEDYSGDSGAVVDLKDLLDGTGPGKEPALIDLGPPDGGRLDLLDGVLVGKELEKQLHLFTGQEVRLVSPLADPANPDATGTPIPFHRDYRIAGKFYTGMYEYDLKFIYVPLESLQEFLQLGDEIDGIEVRISDPEYTGEVRARIARELGADYLVQDWKELNRNLFSALKLEKIAMFLVLAIIILVASFSIIGNLIMIVVEKRKEVALLKTLGASDIGVMRIFVMQGFFIGLVGTLAGIALGLLICWGCQEFGFPINPDVYYIKELPIHIEPWSVVAIAAAGLVISAVATIYPAVVAARLRPAVGLRHD